MPKPTPKTITRIQLKFDNGTTSSQLCHVDVTSIRKFRAEMRRLNPEVGKILLTYEEVDSTPLA